MSSADLVPKRPWSTNGLTVMDADGREIFSIMQKQATIMSISEVACTLEHICHAVNKEYRMEEAKGNHDLCSICHDNPVRSEDGQEICTSCVLRL